MENMPPEQPQFQTSMDVKLDYIQRDVREIKDVLKDNVSRREFTEGLKTVRDQSTESIKEVKDKLDFQGKIIYSFIGVILIGFFGAIIKLVLK